MRQLFAALVFGLGALGLCVTVQADDKAKEETLKGSITCAKCDLGVAKKCETVIKVGEKVFYFDKAAHKKYHADTCQAAKAGEVTGTVSKDGDKDVITIKTLKYSE